MAASEAEVEKARPETIPRFDFRKSSRVASAIQDCIRQRARMGKGEVAGNGTGADLLKRWDASLGARRILRLGGTAGNGVPAYRACHSCVAWLMNLLRHSASTDSTRSTNRGEFPTKTVTGVAFRHRGNG